MKLGFIGTGKIASSVITGICSSKISFTKILISPRNKLIANTLKKKFKKVNIAKNNQDIVNNCNWVFLSVTPVVGKKIIKVLRFKSNQTIISFISTITLSQLKKMIKVNAKIVRAIPLPPISLKKGPVPICPPNKKIKDFFNNIGTAVEIKKSLKGKLELGNIDSFRDWGHSKDYVRAMHMIINHDLPDDFVVSTGKTHSVREMTDYVFSKLGMDYKDYVVQNPKYIRPEELKNLKGDCSKAKKVLGWTPKYTFETMLDEMVSYWLDYYKNK